MARLLHDKGYKKVRPLLGGFDGWVALGYPVERVDTIGVPLPSLSVPGASL